MNSQSTKFFQLGDITIPSEMYPINGEQCQIFSYSTTTPLSLDKKIRRIFDSIGDEYIDSISLSEELTKRLQNEGIPAVMHVGWYYDPKHTVPILHAYVVLWSHVLDLFWLSKDAYQAERDKLTQGFSLDEQTKKEIHDFGASSCFEPKSFNRIDDDNDEDHFNEFQEDDDTKAIEKMMEMIEGDFILEEEQADRKSNSEKNIFGRCEPGTVYVGAPATREWALMTRDKLKEKYPDHPSFQQHVQSF